MDNNFKMKNGSGHLCCKGCGRQDKQLNTYDWLADIPGNTHYPYPLYEAPGHKNEYLHHTIYHSL